MVPIDAGGPEPGILEPPGEIESVAEEEAMTAPKAELESVEWSETTRVRMRVKDRTYTLIARSDGYVVLSYEGPHSDVPTTLWERKP